MVYPTKLHGGDTGKREETDVSVYISGLKPGIKFSWVKKSDLNNSPPLGRDGDDSTGCNFRSVFS